MQVVTHLGKRNAGPMPGMHLFLACSPAGKLSSGRGAPKPGRACRDGVPQIGTGPIYRRGARAARGRVVAWDVGHGGMW